MKRSGQRGARPPRVAEWILRVWLRGEAREVICGDLEEEFRERMRGDSEGETKSNEEAPAYAPVAPLQGTGASAGKLRSQRIHRDEERKARRWYWRQVAGTVAARVGRAGDERNGIEQRTGRQEGTMGTLWQDLRYGMRMLAKSPGMTALAVLTLALGIGANATVFNWVKSVLLEPLPGVEQQGEIIGIFGSDRNMPNRSFSYPNLQDVMARTETLEGVLAHNMTSYSMAQEGRAELVYGQVVSENFFDVLRVRPQQGRGFTAEEGKPGAGRVAVISEGLWKRKFGGDPGILGREILLNGNKFTVVGVTPGEFGGGETGLRFEVWVPIVVSEEIASGGARLKRRGNSWLAVLGRRKAGISTAQVQAEMTKLADDLAKEFPDENKGVSISVFPMWKLPRGAVNILGPVLMILMALAAVVLLIACANVANILLSRAIGRRREMAIRLSLGASRMRIVRQLLIESAVLSAAGGVLAVAIAYATGGLLIALVPPTGLPVGLSTEVDWKLLLFTMAVAMMTAMLFGLAPAVQASRAAPVEALKEEAGSVVGGRRGWLRSTLVVVQVALSLVMLIAAGLFVRSLQKAQTFEPGFNPKGVVLASVALFSNRYNAEAGREFFERALERLEAMPGVKSATLARRIPLGFGGTSSSTITVEGYAPPTREEQPWSYWNLVGPRYFETMQIPLVAGRDFTREDRQGKPLVVIINEELARRYWKDRDPVGQRIDWGGGTWMTIVGVVKNTKMRELKEAQTPYFYSTVLQSYRADMSFHVRTQGDSRAVTGAVRTTLQGMDQEVAIFNLTTLEEYIGAATFQQKLAGTFLAAFGALALVLAAVGIFGVMAYAVSQRTHEIGVRMALGAKPRDVFRLVLRQGMFLLGIGVLIGMAGAAAASQALTKLLFGVSPLDPVTFAAVPVMLAVVALVACWVPARRATRVDPVVALRYE